MENPPAPAPPAPTPAAGGTPPISPPLAGRPEKTGREIELEIKLSKTEDTLDTLKKHLAESTKLLDGANKLPSTRTPGKTMLQDLEDFLGWPDSTPPPTNPS
jgi:hypothetical protein